MIFALIIFLVTYALMLAFQKYRPWIALTSASVFVILGIIGMYDMSFLDALGAVDYNVLLMIGGTMGTVTLFVESKMPARLAEILISKVPDVKWAVTSLALFAGIISAFVDNNPKGFGLLQRDRNPAHYLDFEANYEQRPSVWVEPLGNWGKGWVELVEIPSIQEIHDNVVAYWVPQEKIIPLQPLHYQYRLHWFNKLPVEKIPGDITATYTGIGGVSGMLETQKRKFVIDFDILNMKQEVEKGIARLEVSASEGAISGKHLMYNPVTKGLTAYIDFVPNGKTSELRAVVTKNGKNISEVWSYQWLP